MSIGFDTIEGVEAALPRDAPRRKPVRMEAAFPAGKAFVRYRRERGVRRSPRPDFSIGAHAVIDGMFPITREARRHRAHFPRLQVIAPT